MWGGCPTEAKNAFLKLDSHYLVHIPVRCRGGGFHGTSPKNRGVTGKFFWGGKVIFPDLFPGFFPVEDFHFGCPKITFRRFEKWQARKKMVLSSFSNSFPSFIFNFQSSILQFSFFSSRIFPLFHFFPCLFFPGRSAKISLSEVSGGYSAPCPYPPPPSCYATA